MFKRDPQASVMRGIDFPMAVSSKRIARSSIDPEAAHTKWCVAGHPANAEMVLRDPRERLIWILGGKAAGRMVTRGATSIFKGNHNQG